MIWNKSVIIAELVLALPLRSSSRACSKMIASLAR